MNNIYGCIGEVLKHSFSKEIHNAIADYEYELYEIPKNELGNYMQQAAFKAINVTIPYKELVIPYLYYIDDHAKAIGAVNTVVNRDGKLYGYNTDFYGMSELIRHIGIEVEGKKVAILGSGGTAKTAHAVSIALGADDVLTVSRRKSESTISYDELYDEHADTQIIINTTPVGMYPRIDESPIDLSKLPNVIGVVDAVYNPLRTKLIQDAKDRGIPAEGGLYMLVAQAVRASEIFQDVSYAEELVEKTYRDIIREKENIVLIGMPACGKSTVGALLSDITSRKFVDTDSIVVKNEGCEIREIFANHGEPYFRKLESAAVAECSSLTASIIATGGGVVLNENNIRLLKRNGKVFFIDRPLELLIPTSDRPLTSDRESLKRKYEERYPLYSALADVHINGSMDATAVASFIKGEMLK